MTAENDVAAIRRQVDSIASGVWDNSRAIERNFEANAKEQAKLGVMLKQLHEAIFGNGEPRQGLLYRQTWTEFILKIILLGLILNIVLTTLLGVILFFHLYEGAV